VEQSQAMRQCIENCETCHRTCLSMMGHCLKKGGAHAAADHIRLLADCAQICQTSADFMIRMSPHHRHVCRECSEICAECAKDCDRLGDDAMMKECAAVCNRCSESCRKMAG
jgi:hypothetical protein